MATNQKVIMTAMDNADLHEGVKDVVIKDLGLTDIKSFKYAFTNAENMTPQEFIDALKREQPNGMAKFEDGDEPKFLVFLKDVIGW